MEGVCPWTSSEAKEIVQRLLPWPDGWQPNHSDEPWRVLQANLVHAREKDDCVRVRGCFYQYVDLVHLFKRSAEAIYGRVVWEESVNVVSDALEADSMLSLLRRLSTLTRDDAVVVLEDIYRRGIPFPRPNRRPTWRRYVDCGLAEIVEVSQRMWRQLAIAKSDPTEQREHASSKTTAAVRRISVEQQERGLAVWAGGWSRTTAKETFTGQQKGLLLTLLSGQYRDSAKMQRQNGFPDTFLWSNLRNRRGEELGPHRPEKGGAASHLRTLVKIVRKRLEAILGPPPSGRSWILRENKAYVLNPSVQWKEIGDDDKKCSPGEVYREPNAIERLAATPRDRSRRSAYQCE